MEAEGIERMSPEILSTGKIAGSTDKPMDA
jgi:hypothetical protein